MLVTKRVRNPSGSALFNIFARATYLTLVSAIKESVSNAYDAGANNIAIVFDPDKFAKIEKPKDLMITVQDDGFGMTEDELFTGFLSIGSEKDSGKINPKTNRYSIGHFGIGSFALIKFSLQLIIYSRSRDIGSEPIKCVIDCPRLLQFSEKEYKDHVEECFKSSAIPLDEWLKISNGSDFGTKIIARGVTEEAFEELVRGTGKLDELNFLPEAQLTRGQREIAWELSTLLPLKYASDPEGVSEKYKSYLDTHNPGVSITLSSIALDRVIYSDEDSMVVPFEYQNKGDGVKACGVILCRGGGPVIPRQANGVLLRMNNVGVGKYRLHGVIGQATIRDRLTGEIHIVSGLNDRLNGARDDFQGPTYDRLVDAIKLKLEEVSSKGYKAWEGKRKVKASEEQEKIHEAHRMLQTKGKKGAGIGRSASPRPFQSGSKGLPGISAAEHEPQKELDLPDTGVTAAAPDAGSSSSPALPGASASPGKRARGGIEKGGASLDPLVQVDGIEGKFALDARNSVVKAFKGVQERRALDMFCRAMKSSKVNEKKYKKILDNLLAIRRMLNN